MSNRQRMLFKTVQAADELNLVLLHFLHSQLIAYAGRIYSDLYPLHAPLDRAISGHMSQFNSQPAVPFWI